MGVKKFLPIVLGDMFSTVTSVATRETSSQLLLFDSSWFSIIVIFQVLEEREATTDIID